MDAVDRRGDRPPRARDLRERRDRLRPAHRRRSSRPSCCRRRSRCEVAQAAARRGSRASPSRPSTTSGRSRTRQAYKPRWDSGDPRITTTVEELLQDDVVKLLARHPSLGPGRAAGAGDRGGRRRGHDHALLDRRAARDQRPGRLEGDRTGTASPTGWASRPPTSSRSATCPTTCRCSSGPASGSRSRNAHPWVLERSRRGDREQRRRRRRRGPGPLVPHRMNGIRKGAWRLFRTHADSVHGAS